MLTPEITYLALLWVQALHLLHHRLARRHISFAEVISAVVLCVPPSSGLLPVAELLVLHLGLIGVQIVGSLWIRRLSPTWPTSPTSGLE